MQGGELKDTEGASYVNYLLGDKTNLSVKEGDGGSGAFSWGEIWLDAEQINGMQKGLEKGGLDKNAMSVSMAFLHETLHTEDGAKFFKSDEDMNNKSYFGYFQNESYTTQIVNRFREENGLPTRYLYSGKPSTLYFEKDGNKQQLKFVYKKPTLTQKDKRPFSLWPSKKSKWGKF